MCVLGKRLLKDILPDNCTKEVGGPLYNVFCPHGQCDSYFAGKYFSIAFLEWFKAFGYVILFF